MPKTIRIIVDESFGIMGESVSSHLVNTPDVPPTEWEEKASNAILNFISSWAVSNRAPNATDIHIIEKRNTPNER